MLNEAVKELLNVQVNKEFYSAYLYLSFSSFYVWKRLRDSCSVWAYGWHFPFSKNMENYLI